MAEGYPSFKEHTIKSSHPSKLEVFLCCSVCLNRRSRHMALCDYNSIPHDTSSIYKFSKGLLVTLSLAIACEAIGIQEVPDVMFDDCTLPRIPCTSTNYYKLCWLHDHMCLMPLIKLYGYLGDYFLGD